MVDSIDGLVEREVVFTNLDELLATPIGLPDRETWGTSTAAQASQRAMMAMAGGPAPMREGHTARPQPAPENNGEG